MVGLGLELEHLPSRTADWRSTNRANQAAVIWMTKITMKIWKQLGQSSHGYELPLSNFLRFRLILRGIKPSQGQQSKVRRPKTFQLLNIFYYLLNVQHTDNKDSFAIHALGSYDTGIFRLPSTRRTYLQLNL